ncbi:MAG: hypothetical protein V3W19_18150 [Desulfatiglandales bacterium]
MPAIFPASTKAWGELKDFPNLCNTPSSPVGPIPILYPNFDMNNQLDATTSYYPWSKANLNQFSRTVIQRG